MSSNVKKLGVIGLVVFGLAGWLWGGAQYMYAKNHADVLGRELSSTLIHSINVAQALNEDNESQARKLLDDHINVYATVVKRNAQLLNYEDSEAYEATLERIEEYRQSSLRPSTDNEMAMSDAERY